MWRKTTIGICIGVAVTLIAYDIYVVFINHEKFDSISEVIRDAGEWVAIIPMAWGVLGGHFFSKRLSLFGQPKSVIILSTAGVLASVVSVLSRLYFPWQGSSMMWFLLGILGGYYLWPLGGKDE